MKKLIAKLVVAASVMVAALSGAAFAASAIVENAKSLCIVGEQADGYLGIIDAGKASAELRREVGAVNQQRKAYYSQIAQKNGVTIEVAAAMTAEKLITQASPGQCVRDSTGQWKRK
jgi:hypothetical protein